MIHVLSALLKLASANMGLFIEEIGRLLDDHVETFTIQPKKDGKRSDYLKRWYLTRLLPETRAKYPELHFFLRFIKEFLKIDLYLHKISDDDSDRHLHNHPWNMIAIPFIGGYDEIVPKQGTDGVAEEDRVIVSHEAPTIHAKSCRAFHSVRLKRDGNGDKIINWSIIIRARKEQDWGFMTDEGWIDHTTYLNDLYGPGNWEREIQDVEEAVS